MLFGLGGRRLFDTTLPRRPPFALPQTPSPPPPPQTNVQEQARLRAGGAQLAPLGFHLQGPAKPKEMGVGPLRLWPGGLCVSRSIGDMDTGPLVVPLPHVRQVRAAAWAGAGQGHGAAGGAAALCAAPPTCAPTSASAPPYTHAPQLVVPPERAVRLLLASDGLWDLVSPEKAARAVRSKLPHEVRGRVVGFLGPRAGAGGESGPGSVGTRRLPRFAPPPHTHPPSPTHTPTKTGRGAPGQRRYEGQAHGRRPDPCCG